MICAVEGLPADSLLATPAGKELLKATPELCDLMVAFYNAKSPEAALEHAGCAHIGKGRNTAVWRMGSAALKVATFNAGEERWKKGSSRPDDLTGPAMLMHLLNLVLESEAPDDNVHVPAQFSVLRAPGGYLLAHQHIENAPSLSKHPLLQGLNEQEKSEQCQIVQARIRSAVGKLTFWPMLCAFLGMNDLGHMPGEALQASNVLVPEDAKSLSVDPIYIIDQPQCGLLGAIATRLAERVLRSSQQNLEPVDGLRHLLPQLSFAE